MQGPIQDLQCVHCIASCMPHLHGRLSSQTTVCVTWTAARTKYVSRLDQTGRLPSKRYAAWHSHILHPVLRSRPPRSSKQHGLTRLWRASQWQDAHCQMLAFWCRFFNRPAYFGEIVPRNTTENTVGVAVLVCGQTAVSMQSRYRNWNFLSIRSINKCVLWSLRLTCSHIKSLIHIKYHSAQICEDLHQLQHRPTYLVVCVRHYTSYHPTLSLVRN